MTDLNVRARKSYKLLSNRFDTNAGTVVYEYTGYDYGLCRDDEQATGEEHIVVTENKNGDTPFFTVPISQIIEI